jgi:hypothetical protein
MAEPEVAAVRSFLLANNDVLPGTIGAVEYQNFDNHPAASAWSAVREALTRDADAQLP